jgi:predicted dehydrogenase
MKKIKIAIIGAGLIGCERIEAINYISKATNGKVSIAAVFDSNLEQLSKIEKKYNVPIVSDINDAMSLKPDWVFIATSNDVVKDIAKQAFEVGANVLMEKPFGRSLAEAEEIIKLKPTQCKLNVGFNYRFFAGIEAALCDAKTGKFGKLISVNLILGHGNSPGMEKSWRFNPSKGGDCSTDLGVHLFDIILQLSSGNVSVDYAKSWSGFWNTGIEEEVHMMLSDEAGTIFNAQVSFNRWKSTFRLEINGTEGYGIVENRGRSYGPQSYRTGVRWGWLSGKNQAESEILVVDKNDCKDSFIKETIAVLDLGDLILSTQMSCNYIEARNTMSLLEKVRNKIKEL